MPKEERQSKENCNFSRGPDQPDPAVLLIEALQQLIEMLNDKNSQKISEHTMPMLYQVGQIETKQQQSIYHLESIRKQLEVLISNNKLLENASSSNQVLSKQHYDEHVIEPMVRSLFPVFDIIEDAAKPWNNSNEKMNMDFIRAVLTQLTQFLVNYDVHIIRHNSDAEFNPLVMKPIKWVLTDKKELDGLVAESMQIGFRFGQEKVLRLECVSLFKYSASQKNEMLTISERKENDNSRN